LDRFVGIAVDFREDVLAYVKERPIDYPLLIGEEDGLEALKSVGMTAAFPFTLFAILTRVAFFPSPWRITPDLSVI
jgi:hypothetical protein